MKTFPRFIAARGPRSRHEFFRHEIAPTESFFGRWSRFCWQTALSGAEATEMLAPFNAKAPILCPELGTQRWAPNSHLLWDKPSAHRSLSKHLGLNEDDLDCCTGTSVGDRQLFRRAFAPHLRWCRECMGAGFHSMVLQHRAVTACPLHGGQLLEACPGCGFLVEPSYWSVARQPFGCDQCGFICLFEGVRPKPSAELTTLGAMLIDRAHDLGLSLEPRRTFAVRSTRGAAVSTIAPLAARTVARSCVWPLGRDPRWPKFRTSHALLPDWQAAGGTPAAMHDAVRDCLSWLEHVCARPEDSHALRYLSFHEMAGDRHPVMRPVSLAAVALHKTVVRYGSGRLLSSEPSRAAGAKVYADVVWSGSQIASPLPESPLGNALLLRAEMLAYFAVSLLEASRIDYIRPSFWEMNGDNGRLAAVDWVVEEGGRGHELYFRPRATTQFVARLFRRYGHRTIEAWPDLVQVGASRGMFLSLRPGTFDAWFHEMRYRRPSSTPRWKEQAETSATKPGLAWEEASRKPSPAPTCAVPQDLGAASDSPV